MPNRYIKTRYCNKYHRLSDGVPIKHPCRILPPAVLRAEQNDDVEAQMDFWDSAPPIILHGGEGGDVPDDDQPPRFCVAM